MSEKKYFENNKELFEYKMWWQLSSKELAFHEHL